MKVYNKEFNTFPFFLHCPVSDIEYKENWQKIHFFFSKFKEESKLNELKEDLDFDIITFNNLDHKQVCEKSCDYFKIKYYVLGKEIKDWKNPIKIDLVYNFLKKCNKKYLIGLDSFDLAMVRKIDNSVLEKIKNKKLIYNKTPIVWPPNIETTFLNLNAGAWIGEVDFLKVFYEKLLFFKNNFESWSNGDIIFETSEQACVKVCADEFKDEIFLDHRCEIFQIIHHEKNENLYINWTSETQKKYKKKWFI